MVETDCSENYPSRNIDENYPNGHSYQTTWPSSSMIMNWYQNQYFFHSKVLCLPPKKNPSLYIHQNMPFQFRSMSIQILSNVLKIEAPTMHHIILLCWNVFLCLDSWILVSDGHTVIMQSSVVEGLLCISYIFIPSLKHTDVSHSTFKALLILKYC